MIRVERKDTRFHTDRNVRVLHNPAIHSMVRTTPTGKWLYLRKPKTMPGECKVTRCRNNITGTRLRNGETICSRRDKRLWRINNPEKAAFQNIRARAARKKIVFTITFENFMEEIKGTGYVEGRGCSPASLHLDRKDPLLGYEPGNLKVLTCAENCAKGGGYDKSQHRNRHMDEAHYLPDDDDENPF